MFFEYARIIEKKMSAQFFRMGLENNAILTCLLPSLDHWRRQLESECSTEKEVTMARKCILARNNIMVDLSDLKEQIFDFDFGSPNSLRWFISGLDSLADNASYDRELRSAAHHLVCVLNNLKVNSLLTDQKQTVFLGLTTPTRGGDYVYNMCQRYKRVWLGRSRDIDKLIIKLDELMIILSKLPNIFLRV
jgi:hypothetical protein